MHEKSIVISPAVALGAALVACTGPVSTSHVAIAISPPAVSVPSGQTEQFSATLTGTSDTAVTWSVSEAAGGTISAAGLYTAPPAAGTYHVVATSQVDSSRSAIATVTVTAAGTAPARESWVWVYADYANVLDAIGAHKASFTHVSPTFYTVNYGYQSGVAWYSNCPNMSNCSANGTNSFNGLTTRQFTDRVAALGLVTVPLIYGGAGNAGTDTGIQNILDNLNGAGDAFVAAMAAEAVANGYGGYNIDWETGGAINDAYAGKFVAFVDKFKAALAPHGMSLSVDAIVSDIDGSWCSGNHGYMDFPKLAASSVDRIMIEDYTSRFGTATTSCQNTVLSNTSPALCDFTFTGMLNMMCSPNLPLDKAVIGLEANPTNTNLIAGAAFSTIRSYGFTRVAVWPQQPFMNATGIQPAGATWYGLLQGFLAP